MEKQTFSSGTIYGQTSGFMKWMGIAVVDSNPIASLGIQWIVAAVADYNGDDNRADILFRDQDTGDLWIYRMNGHVI